MFIPQGRDNNAHQRCTAGFRGVTYLLLDLRLAKQLYANTARHLYASVPTFSAMRHCSRWTTRLSCSSFGEAWCYFASKTVQRSVVASRGEIGRIRDVWSIWRPALDCPLSGDRDGKLALNASSSSRRFRS